MKMKSSFLTIAFFVSCLSAFAQWIFQNSNVETNLNSVFFVDELTGWIVGNQGVILNTTDGGDSWIQQFNGTNFDFGDVCFANQHSGCITGNKWDPCETVILRTQNDGVTWDTVFHVQDFLFTDIMFCDSLNGFATGRNRWPGTPGMAKSSDGGASWEWMISAGRVGTHVHFLNPDTGWSVGGWSSGSSGLTYGRIYKTIDGGLNWQNQFDSTISGYLNSVHFIDVNCGWAVGGNSGWGALPPNSAILRTIDGGENWEAQIGITNRVLSDVFFADSQNGWVVGGWSAYIGSDTSIILHTNDGGNNWEFQASETTCPLYSVCFIDSQTGWIVGSNGTILHTNNAGVSIDELLLNKLQISVIPNPFNTSTTLSFRLVKPENVQFTVYNVQSQIVYTIEERQEKGEQNFHWNAEGLPAGMYYFRVQAGEMVGSGKMMFLKK